MRDIDVVRGELFCVYDLAGMAEDGMRVTVVLLGTGPGPVFGDGITVLRAGSREEGWRLADGDVVAFFDTRYEAGVEWGEALGTAPVVFGHAGNGHPHCNYIGRDAAEVKRIEAVVERTLRDVITLGGTVAAEHGIGKVKAKWLPLQFSATQQRMLRAIKRELDPAGLLAPGNLL